MTMAFAFLAGMGAEDDDDIDAHRMDAAMRRRHERRAPFTVLAP